MNKFYPQTHPEIFDAFAKANQYWKESGLPIYPEAQKIIKELEPFERHIPILASYLDRWRAEIPLHGKSSYAEILKRDIKFAEECNKNGSEMLVSYA